MRTSAATETSQATSSTINKQENLLMVNFDSRVQRPKKVHELVED